MFTINPYIFKQFPEITFGFSTKIGLERKRPYYFNMSYTVGDNSQRVTENRNAFFKNLGLSAESVAHQIQVHGNSITFVEEGGECGESDGMITTKKNLGLAISSADCCAIFIFDPVKKVIAAVHSGWRGTNKNILLNVLQQLSREFNCDFQNLVCYFSPSIFQNNYEVGPEVADQFDSDYLLQNNRKFFLNIPKINYDVLLSFGVCDHNIQISNLCTYEYSTIMNSYRRDGKQSGRALGIIAMRGDE
jgi:YfiH family protein